MLLSPEDKFSSVLGNRDCRRNSDGCSSPSALASIFSPYTMALIANPNLLVFQHCLNLIHSHPESAHILCVIFTPSLTCMAGWLAGVGLFEGTSIISPASDSDLLHYTKKAEPLCLLFSSTMAHRIFACSQRRKSEHLVYQGIVLV